MKLYVGVLSLFSGKTRIAIAEKGLVPELVYVGWSREDRYRPHHPDVVALNPKAQVPVLVDGDTVVYDSTQILEYLEERCPEPALYPRGLAERARCRRLEAEGDELWFPHVWDLIESRFYPRDADGAAPDGQAAQDALAARYADLEKQLVARDFLLGDFSVADLSIFIQVQAAQSLGAAPPESCAAVRAWAARIASRASVVPVLSEMTHAAADALSG